MEGELRASLERWERGVKERNEKDRARREEERNVRARAERRRGTYEKERRREAERRQAGDLDFRPKDPNPLNQEKPKNVPAKALVPSTMPSGKPWIIPNKGVRKRDLRQEKLWIISKKCQEKLKNEAAKSMVPSPIPSGRRCTPKETPEEKDGCEDRGNEDDGNTSQRDGKDEVLHSLEIDLGTEEHNQQPPPDKWRDMAADETSKGALNAKALRPFASLYHCKLPWCESAKSTATNSEISTQDGNTEMLRPLPRWLPESDRKYFVARAIGAESQSQPPSDGDEEKEEENKYSSDVKGEKEAGAGENGSDHEDGGQ